jgi:hypothetical protein
LASKAQPEVGTGEKDEEWICQKIRRRRKNTIEKIHSLIKLR